MFLQHATKLGLISSTLDAVGRRLAPAQPMSLRSKLSPVRQERHNMSHGSKFPAPQVTYTRG